MTTQDEDWLYTTFTYKSLKICLLRKELKQLVITHRYPGFSNAGRDWRLTTGLLSHLGHLLSSLNPKIMCGSVTGKQGLWRTGSLRPESNSHSFSKHCLSTYCAGCWGRDLPPGELLVPSKFKSVEEKDTSAYGSPEGRDLTQVGEGMGAQGRLSERSDD